VPKDIDKIITEQFSFLVDNYGYTCRKPKYTTGGCITVYKGKTCGVKIHYEFREARLDVKLYKLENGELIDSPVNITESTYLTAFSLDDIVLLRAPDHFIKPAYFYPITSKYYDPELGLTSYVGDIVENLKSFASDVLSGNFTVFEDLTKAVLERLRNFAKQ